MVTLTQISLIAGVVLAGVTLLEKFFHIFSRTRGSRKVFEQEFTKWKESAYSYIAPHENLRRFAGYVLRSQLDEERSIFGLLCAIQHGDKLLHDLIAKNYANSIAIPFVFDFVSGRGIRIGWRAEYVLSRFNVGEVKKYIDHLPQTSKKDENLSSSIERILKHRVEDFLRSQLTSDNTKLRVHADEVLKQIQSRSVPRPSVRGI